MERTDIYINSGKMRNWLVRIGLIFYPVFFGNAQTPCEPGSLTIKWTTSDDFTDPVGIDKNNRLNAAFFSSKPLMIPRLNKAFD